MSEIRADSSSRVASRRRFLKHATAAAVGAGAAGAFGFPTIIPSSALGKDGAVAPSNRMTLGVIGTGGRGHGDMQEFMNFPQIQVIAICDVDERHARAALNTVNKKYGDGNCKLIHDYHEVVAMPDVDIVQVTTPDHWHAMASVAALDAKKDVFCEKPLTNSIFEGRRVCEAVKRNDRILQVGSQERSAPYSRLAAEVVQSGRIGKLQTIKVCLPCQESHHKRVRSVKGIPETTTPPPEFDYDFWLGHTPKVDYNELRTHFYWRFILTYGGGEMTDRGAHVLDLAQLVHGTDLTGPVEFEGKGVQTPGAMFNAFWDYNFTNAYADGVTLIGTAQGSEDDRGVTFEGTDGWVKIHVHGGPVTASKPEILSTPLGDKDVKIGRTESHKANFLEAVMLRKPGFAPAEVGHRTATICHLNNIAMQTGKKIVWDPEKETITNDPSLNQFLNPGFRPPYVM